MAYYNQGLLSSHDNFVINHIGGNSSNDNSSQYINNQKNIITKNNAKRPISYKTPFDDIYVDNVNGSSINRSERTNNSKEENGEDRYDPYTDFLFKRGLLDRDNVTRYIKHYISIDSSNREILPSVVTENATLLNTDPFSIMKGSNMLYINHENHNMQVNDRITVTGCQGASVILRTVTGVNQKSINFVDGSEYMAISYPHGLQYNNYTEASKYDASDMLIEITGLKGYPSNSYIGNIPIITINGIHRIYVINPEKSPSNINDPAYKTDTFYIKLLKKFKGSFSPGAYNIRLTFYHHAGIPINYINAEYPIDSKNLQGYHIVTSVKKTGYFIKLKKQSAASVQFGSDNIYVAKVTDINNGYIEPNNYTIPLGKLYTNVVMVKMISSEFPNTEKVIKSTPENKKNNKLYWQNLEDGDYMYSIELNSGNYNPISLVNAIQTKIADVPRIDISGDIPVSYTLKNFVSVTIDPDTDLVSFKSFKEWFLVKPIINISPPIDIKGNDPIIPVTEYELTIQHNNHGLKAGDIITITKAIQHYGIPEAILNDVHTISDVDDNTYKIKIKHFNLDRYRDNTGGGMGVYVYAPNIFKMRFDYPDTIGNLLGFRNCGTESAVTKFSTVITNSDQYENETLIDETGNKKVIKNNSINLSGDNYILVECDKFKVIENLGKVKDVFAKILLSGAPGKVLFNTFVMTPKYYFDPIPEISSLTFSFYSPDGNLYDFNGLNHSFILEITTLNELPKGVGISNNMGKIA
jgi:hypothetical protein